MTKAAVLAAIDAAAPERLTTEDLVERLRCPRAVVRAVLAELVFARTGSPPVSRYMVTRDAEGRLYRGDPQPLYDQGPMR